MDKTNTNYCSMLELYWDNGKENGNHYNGAIQGLGLWFGV